MVEKIKNLIRQVEADKGGIVLFMLWKDAPEVDKWAVVISASWLNAVDQRTSLDYWIKILQRNLDQQELLSISRVSFLRTDDPFVQMMTRSLNVSGGAVRFTNNQIGNYFVNDAIIFEAKSVATGPALNFVRKNPLVNGSINPNINGSINPSINGSINPNINGSINPSMNPNFTGFILFDLGLNKTAFLITANENILLMFDFANRYLGFCIKTPKENYNVFDLSNTWIGYLVSNKKDGFNYFDVNGRWIGFIV